MNMIFLTDHRQARNIEFIQHFKGRVSQESITCNPAPITSVDWLDSTFSAKSFSMSFFSVKPSFLDMSVLVALNAAMIETTLVVNYSEIKLFVY